MSMYEDPNIQDKANPKSNRKKPRTLKKFILTIVIPFFVLLVILNNAFVLRPHEYGIIKEFGKIVRVIDTEDLHFKSPIIQSKSKLPKNVLLYNVPAAEINTLDKKRILVDYYALWRITDPVKMIESLKTLEGAESRLSDIIYSNIRNELGKLEYGQIINPDGVRRGKVEEVVLEQVNERLVANNNGIELVDIQMKRIDLPTSNEESVYRRMISERESKAQEYLSQGDAEARKIMAEADREVEETIAKAKAEAEQIVAEGEAEAARIYNEAYGKDAEFFKLYTTLESYKTVINGEKVILLPIDSPYLKYLMGY